MSIDSSLVFFELVQLALRLLDARHNVPRKLVEFSLVFLFYHLLAVNFRIQSIHITHGLLKCADQCDSILLQRLFNLFVFLDDSLLVFQHVLYFTELLFCSRKLFRCLCESHLCLEQVPLFLLNFSSLQVEKVFNFNLCSFQCLQLHLHLCNLTRIVLNSGFHLIKGVLGNVESIFSFSSSSKVVGEAGNLFFHLLQNSLLCCLLVDSWSVLNVLSSASIIQSAHSFVQTLVRR
mmetsp:Transcript_14112/g.19647  ORF Transcript_14112/g.19647 Transcript_14112/m.19647 type:complete len:234 (-) Transcript_14112:173-874(-)